MKILAAGSYIPRSRLDRTSAGIGRGTRSVASFDEDTTSMAVEAGRLALRAVPEVAVSSVLFATTTPPYSDRTNATAIAAALDLGMAVGCYDTVGSVRSAIGALRSAADGATAGRHTLLVTADIRIGLPGSADERDGGDAGCALVLGPSGPFLGEIVGTGSASKEFLDRWRVPGEPTSRVWEERFGETEYLPLAEQALTHGLESAGLAIDEVDHLIVTGLHTRAVGVVRRSAAVRPEAFVDDLSATIGFSGAAHPILLLVDVLERATVGQNVVLLTLSDGADCVAVRAGELAGGAASSTTVQDQIPGVPVDYNDLLVWRGLLKREAPRRPDPDRPAAPPSSRNAGWKFALVGSRCTDCGTRHLPPERICLSCRSRDHMDRDLLADVGGTITTFAIDHLAFSVAPPVVVAIVDLDGGGRIQCELADVDPNAVRVGDRVEMTFRRLHTTIDGVHNYFWKARMVLHGGN